MPIAIIEASELGQNLIVPLAEGQSIVTHVIILTSPVAVAFKFQSNDTDLHPYMNLGANLPFTVALPVPAPLFATALGEDLNLNLSLPALVTGWLLYSFGA